jgi:hypothetical protein
MDLVVRVWNFVREPLNLAVIVALGGGVAWLWHEATDRAHDAKTEPAPLVQNATASGSGTATNAAQNSVVSYGQRLGATSPSSPSAVNASGSANVTISNSASTVR